jgi:hypothetical protein
MSTREYGTITAAHVGRDMDHGIAVVSLQFTFDGCGVQSLQCCLRSDDEAAELGREVCRLFGVEHVEQIIGRHAYALRAFPYYNELIVGVEVEGQRLVVDAWANRDNPGAPSLLRRRRSRASAPPRLAPSRREPRADLVPARRLRLRRRVPAGAS